MKDDIQKALELSIAGKRDDAKAAIKASLDQRKSTILGDAKTFIKQNLFGAKQS